MRVLFASATEFQYLGAVLPALEQRGYAFRKVGLDTLCGDGPRFLPASMRRYYHDRRMLQPYRDVIEEFRPDIVHVMGLRSYLLKTLAVLKDYPGIGLIYERISAGGINILSPLDPLLFRSDRIDRMVMPSKAMLNNWMGSAYTRLIARRERCEPLHYAFPLPQPLSAEARRTLRLELGLDPDAFIVGTVCHIRPWKAVEFVAEAVSSIATDRRLQFAVAGGWDARSGYVDTVRAAGGARLKLLGHVPEAHRIMGAFDLYVTPTFLPGESFGMAFAEAMAWGVPGITMNYGASAEVCDHGFTGYALPENKAVWRRHIAELMQDDALRQAMGKAARQRIADRFTPEKRAADYDRVYRTVAEERAARM
ncbi:MAG: glycosyltransferase family 4 protein [Brucellaceae bacterium]|nr:glycosyltransferase family 4 protein [Brucellaceae bacterium]